MEAPTPAAAPSLTPAIDPERLAGLFSLKGKTALVPGGYGALGEAICLALAAHGASVVVAGPKQEKAQALADQVAGQGGTAWALGLDASDVDAIRSTVEEAVSLAGGIDILVNCVGIQREQSIFDVTPEAFDTMYATNLRSAMFLSQSVAKHQVDTARQGRHIHLLSVRSQLALRGRGYSAYCATKGGLLMLVKQHAMELAPYGITVNGVAPTFIQSDRIRPHLEREEFRNFILNRNPLGRIGEPVEVAGQVIAFAAPAGSYITGQVVYIDGGVTASQ
ncbi:SDR family oxidoreductase [Thalassobaculum sp. OXR-137]|uniref:SDR family NAD(P)-dependent oxidoreductase n=1 Tax=Thalassobaculum sp. OXR-137 TaxID=3100173 RepID=UPI002AC927A2|nr:SDR family oxidoreductase [Thalassobaculum sp. OXR-137]WPZ32687.1 SDR family oxidoreductase [Thalassobaculum sp. OXR-137]